MKIFEPVRKSMPVAKPPSKNWLRLSYIPRRSTVVPQKIQPFPSEEHPSPTIDTNEPIPTDISLDSPPENSLELQQITQTTVLSSSDNIIVPKKPRTSTAFIKKSSLVFDEIQSPKEEEHSNHCVKKCFNWFSLKQKTLLILTAIFLLIVGATAAVVVPIYLFVMRQPSQESSFTNITATTCSLTTCIGKETPYRTSMIIALYPFDGNPNDLSGYATGTPYGVALPSYSTPNYVGTNSLSLVAASSQYIQIPYVNLAQNFTIETWVYPQAPLTGDFGIFGQCDSNSKCLSISLRNGRFTLSFDSMNTNNYTLVSSNVVVFNDWTHLTVVYDAASYQQQLYVNGRIDAISRGTVASFSGTSSGSITTIGRSLSSAYGTSYFQGRIDHFTISAGVTRTSCQIYNDASLVAYYPFDTTGTYNDYSVNLFHGMASGTTTIAQGRSGQALYFSSNTSYFQAQCFPNMDTSNVSLSFSLWINPDNINGGGSVIHVSNLQNGSGNCYDLLTFTSAGAMVVQLMQIISIVNGTQGPVIPANTWTHIAIVFGATNGLRIYINGQLSTLSLSTFQGTTNIGYPQFITLGNNSPLGPSALTSCRNGTTPVTPGLFKGAIDEFRLYNRELDNQEICVLANI